MTIHNEARDAIHQKLLEKIAEGRLPFVDWKCSSCYGQHGANLLEGVASAEKEFPVHGSDRTPRADIALMDSDGRVIACIEVVDTHPPNDYARRVYGELDILLIEVNVKTRKELVAILQAEKQFTFLKSNPNRILGEARDFIGLDLNELQVNEAWFIPAAKMDLCYMPKCDCGERFKRREIFIQDSSCWKCENHLKLAAEGFYGPRTFSKEEIEYSIGEGAYFEEKFSNAANESYLGNVCKSCGSLQGDHFLHQEIDVYDGHSTAIMMGCESCERTEKYYELKNPA